MKFFLGEKSLLKGNKGVRRHKGRLSTFHGDDKRKKIFAPANYNQGDERDGGRQKREKILPLSHRREGGEVNSLHLKLEPEQGGGVGGGGDLTDVGAISGRSSWLSCCHRPEYYSVEMKRRVRSGGSTEI